MLMPQNYGKSHVVLWMLYVYIVQPDSQALPPLSYSQTTM